MGLIVATANFYLTNAGKAAALDAANNSINIEVTQIAIGTAKYDAQVTAPTQTALTTEVGRYNLVGGGSSGQVLRLTTTLTPNYTAEIFEIGLFLSDGTLFAVAAVTGTDPLMQTANGLTSVITLGCSLAEVGSNVTVSVDANSPIAVALMNQHIEHSDPHPQYASKLYVNDKINDLSEIIPWRMYFGDVNQPDDLSQSNNTNTLISIASNSGEKYGGSTIITGTGNVSVSNILPLGGLEVHGALDNTLTSTATNAALTAAQGKVLNEAKFDKAGGAITGNLTIEGQTYARAVWIQSNVNNSNMAMSIDSSTNQVLFQHSPISGAGGFKFDKGLEAKTEVKSEMLKVDNVNNITTISHQSGGGRSLFHTDCNVFQFDKDVYFGSVQKAANGYTSLPNGLIMQWGRYDTTVVEGPVTINFPIGFPNACLSVTATRMSADADNVDSDGGALYVSSSPTTATFNLQGWYGNAKGNLRGFTWLAIGY